MKSQNAIAVDVDITNPGQFFACCGLLELADRLWPGAEGYYTPDDRTFRIEHGGTLKQLVESIARAELRQVREDDLYSSPVEIGDPFRPLMVDWWEVEYTGARDLKVWAGTMESFGIAQAMQHALRDPKFTSPELFNIGMVVKVPGEPSKKKEPFYFDARRTPNAHSRDVGFSTNDLGMSSTAHPAVELLCLTGLQVARPTPDKDQKRIYDYFTWHDPLPSNILLAASTGEMHLPDARRYRFENWFRTGQKKHKAFRSATCLSTGD